MFFFLIEKLFNVEVSIMGASPCSLRVRLIGGMKKWEDKYEEGIEKWKIRRDLVFSYLCLVGRMKNGKIENLFVWLRKKKMRRWKSEVGISLQLCPH